MCLGLKYMKKKFFLYELPKIFDVGDIVRIHGLTKRVSQKFNGQIGKVVKCSGENTWKVKLEKTGKKYGIDVENLALVDDYWVKF
jgi:hypothetical protein